METACEERVTFDLDAQAVSFHPSLEKVQLVVHMSRSLSDQLLRVGRSTVSFIRVFAPSWRMSVIGANCGMNCCLPSADMGSSSTRNRITPFTPTIPARKSRTCTTLAAPIPPHVAIMCVGVTSAGTGPCRSRSRSHQRRAAEDPQNRFLCSSVPSSHELVPGSNRQNVPNRSCFPPQSSTHHQTKGKTTNHAIVQKHLLAKRNPWLEIGECVLRCWVLTLSRHMSKLLATVATGSFSQLGSIDTFCAVIFRFVSERRADVSVSSRWFLLEHSFAHNFLEPACLGFIVATSYDRITQILPNFPVSLRPSRQRTRFSLIQKSFPWDGYHQSRPVFVHQRIDVIINFFRIPIQLITLCSDAASRLGK